MITFKDIKPSRLKDDVMRLTLLSAMHKAARDIRKDFEKTTRTWEHKPKFEEMISLTGPGPVALVGTDDKLYRWVDEGTRPHDIWAGFYTGKSMHRALAFRSEFKPKTTPRVIGSEAGATWGTQVFTPMVQHPGTEPRHFDKTIEEMWDSKFKRRMEEAMREAAEKSGHKA